MRCEIAMLAERIVEPVAAKLSTRELEHVVGQINSAFERFDKARTAAGIDFESIAINIVEPLQSELSDPEFRRMIDRLRGAMIGFCQRNDWGQSTTYRRPRVGSLMGAAISHATSLRRSSRPRHAV